MAQPLPPLHILIAAPRGFCAGVDRAITDRRAGDRALRPAGLCPPRNRPQPLRRRPAARAWARCSSRSWTRCPTAGRWCSRAHGVPKVVPAAAEARGLDYLDATCPLVSKVHRQAQRLIEAGRHILFIGHAGHPEVIGTFGQVPEGAMTLVETVERGRGDRGRRPRQSGLPDPDHAVGRRHRGDRRRAAAPLPDDPRAARRGHLLRHLQPPGARSRRSPRAMRADAGDRRAQQQQFAAPRRGRRAAGRAGAADPARRRHRLGLARQPGACSA